MSVLHVVLYPDAPLRETAAPVVQFGPRLKQLAEDMLETMHANAGVGLAAPQVGVSRRFLVACESEAAPLFLANPEIIDMDGQMYGEEGCLSLPEVHAMVPRSTFIRLKAQDLDGNPLVIEARDFLARIIQHEYDHLHGKVFPDRLDAFSRDDTLREWQQVRRKITEEAVAGAD